MDLQRWKGLDEQALLEELEGQEEHTIASVKIKTTYEDEVKETLLNAAEAESIEEVKFALQQVSTKLNSVDLWMEALSLCTFYLRKELMVHALKLNPSSSVLWQKRLGMEWTLDDKAELLENALSTGNHSPNTKKFLNSTLEELYESELGTSGASGLNDLGQYADIDN